MAFGFGFGFSRLYGALAAAFSPASLFAAGEQGAWYDPSDYGVNGTLFQDSAGTIPVTAVQQPVGLMLDKSKGLVLGPELVVNGDFSNGTTGWTAGTNITATVVSGAVNVSRSGAITPSNTFGQSTTTVANRWYLVAVEVTQNNGAAFSFTDASGTSYTGFAPQSIIGTGVKRYRVFATSTTLRINLWTDDLSTSSFDNISVKELPGNHAFQTTSASRPVLSARYNLLTKTEQFDDAVWGKTGNGQITVTANQAVAPDGTTTADLIVPNALSGYHVIRQPGSTPAARCKQFIYYKPAGYTKVSLREDYAVGQFAAFNCSGAGSILSQSVGATAGITALPNGWYELTLTPTTTSSNQGMGLYVMDNGYMSNDPAGYIYTGDGTSGGYLWGADLRVSNDALGQPAYQRVNTSTDYDTVGFKPYLAFDGVDDSLVTNSIDFTATDKMTVFAGVRKLNDTTGGVIFEMAPGSSFNGTLRAYAGNASTAAGPHYTFETRGTLPVPLQALNSYSAPITNILTGIGNISGDSAILRINGTQVVSNTGDQGTGNYGNYPLFIGRRNQDSLPANIRLYSLIVRGAASTTAQITSTETYVNQKTGAY